MSSIFLAQNQEQSLVISRFKDDQGRQVAENSALVLTVEQFASRNRLQADSIRREIGGLRNLVASLSASTTTERTIYSQGRDTVIYRPDSTRLDAKKYHYSDTWLTSTALIVEDSMALKVRLRERFNYTLYRKSSGFLKPDILTLRATPESPYTVVDTMSVIYIQNPRVPWWRSTGAKVAVGVLAGAVIAGAAR